MTASVCSSSVNQSRRLRAQARRASAAMVRSPSFMATFHRNRCTGRSDAPAVWYRRVMSAMASSILARGISGNVGR